MEVKKRKHDFRSGVGRRPSFVEEKSGRQDDDDDYSQEKKNEDEDAWLCDPSFLEELDSLERIIQKGRTRRMPSRLPPEVWNHVSKMAPSSSILPLSLTSKEIRSVSMEQILSRRREKLRAVLESMNRDRILRLIVSDVIRTIGMGYKDVLREEYFMDPKEVDRIYHSDYFLDEDSSDRIIGSFDRNLMRDAGGHMIISMTIILNDFLSGIVYFSPKGSNNMNGNMINKHEKKKGGFVRIWMLDRQGDTISVTIRNRFHYSLTISEEGEGSRALVLKIVNHQRRKAERDELGRPVKSYNDPISELMDVCYLMSGILFSYVKLIQSI